MSAIPGYRTRAELASALGVSPRTVERWDRERIGPPSTKVGRIRLYQVEGTDRWLAEGGCKRPGRVA